MRSSFQDIVYGISLADTPEPEARELGLLPVGNGSFGLEISGRFIERYGRESCLKRGRLTAINVTDLMPSSITRGIAVQRPGIIADFKRQFTQLLGGSGTAPIDCAIVDFGLDEAMESKEYALQLDNFLRGLAMELHLLQVRLALPVRIPEYRADFTRHCLALRDRVMLPSLTFAVDIHPHELGKEFDPAGLLRWLRFDIGTVRFCYEPAIGNHLVGKAIRPWIDYLRQIGFNGMVTFCPRTGRFEQLIQEVANLRELIRSLDRD